MSSIENSKRIKAFRRELIATVPRFPNNRASLEAMEAKHLTDLLITFIGWRLRFVGVRKRKVIGRKVLSGDVRASTLKSNIDGLLKAVKAGENLTPYLSLAPLTQGYTPVADTRMPGGNTWADKDFLLNVMGLHHFHLGMTKEAAGHMARTNEVLFASVTRDTFEIIGLFDHAAFEHDLHGSMTPERERLWSAFQAREAAGLLPGQLYIGGYAGLGITTGSTPVAVTRAAQRHIQIIREFEPKLDDRDFLATLYPDGKVPLKPKLKWHYSHLDLALLDEGANFLGILERGPN